MKLKIGDKPMIGVAAQCRLLAGWSDQNGPINPDGYQAEYYFRDGCYLGPDSHGVEPEFREMSDAEIAEYLHQDS